jgi:hypothetical protein
MDTKIPEEEIIWRYSQIPGGDLSRISRAEREPDSGRTYMRGSHPYANRNTAEVCGIPCDRIIKGKSAISIARTYMGRKRNFTGENFWAKGYYVSTVGREEESIRKYIREQEAGDKRLEQLEMFKEN